jgi:hypothetical protein
MAPVELGEGQSAHAAEEISIERALRGPGPRIVDVVCGFRRCVDLGIARRTSCGLRSRVGEKSNMMFNARMWGGPAANAHMWGLGREEHHDGRCSCVWRK